MLMIVKSRRIIIKCYSILSTFVQCVLANLTCSQYTTKEEKNARNKLWCTSEIF